MRKPNFGPISIMKFPSILLLGASVVAVRAEYHNFNTAWGSDGIVQEVRWPYWAETTYNAIYSQTLSGSDGGSCYFYGGMPSDPNGNPPCSIIWSFWPPGGTAVPGAAVTADWTATNMYAPPHVGEGASGKAAGPWPLITTNRWYREVLRVWQPADGTPHLGFIARWLRDPATGNWYHLATMRVPFAATGINGLSGFQEDFGHGNRNPRRTDYRNVYYHTYGGAAWQMANRFTPSVRQVGERGSAALIDGNTAAYFETCTSTSYSGNLDYDLGQTSVTLTISNQPAAPMIDPIVVDSSSATVSGDQLITAWQLPPTSSPQFAYRVEVFNNSDYTGSPAVSFYDIDPEARQKLLAISGVATPYVRLTIMDVFNVTNAPILITPDIATLSPATNIIGAVNGLAYKYYEKATDFGSLPNFASLTPVYQGVVNFPDLTIRDQRRHYAFNFTGFIDVPADGLYTFTLNSSDGSRLVIDGATVVNWDGQHSPGPMNGWTALQAGKHAVNVQYFFDNQNSNAGDLIDSLTVSWAGPGLTSAAEIPVSAWFRVPDAGEPALALTSPADGDSITGSNVPFSAAVTANGAAVNKVCFYVGDTYWGQDTSAPFDLNSFVWSASGNAMHARLYYNTSHTLDSAQNIVTTTNQPLAPWLLASVSDHSYPNGARIANGTYSLIGDGLNFLGRQVSGDCTIIAHVVDMISTAAGPDGQSPDRSWEAGIIMRETTNSTPGTPLGNDGSAQYAAAFATVNNDTHFQDGTMSNGGGPYWSSGLGGQRWLKLQRVGNVFTTFVSTDGAAWTPVNTNALSGISSTLYVGMFTYAASSQNPNVHWAAFDSVSLTGNVVGPPAVTVAPQSATAYTGQSVTFTALPSGNAPFSYQWQRNSVNLPGETNATLTLNNLQPTNSGLYTLTLTNTSGSATATAILTVLTPLPVTSQIVSANPLAYWRLNDAGPTAVDLMGNFTGTGQGGVVFGGAGVSSPFTGFESGNLAAQFNGTDSSIVIPPLGVTTTNFTITGWVKRSGSQNDWSGIVFGRQGGNRGVGVMVVNNALRFGWNDDGADYNWSSGLTLTDGQWTFFALTVEPTRSILYKATGGTLSSATRNVANKALTISSSFWLGTDGSGSSRRFNGAVDEVAVYNRTLTSTELTAILNASLSAVPGVAITSPVEGSVFPNPSDINIAAAVTSNGHTINKVQLFNGPVLLGEDSTAPFSLTWSNVSAGDFTLVAQASYDGSSVMSSIPVNFGVQLPVSITTGPQSQTNLEGRSVTFSITASGAPPYTYQWQHNGTNLSEATNATLNLASCQVADAGDYRVLVTDYLNTSATSSVATLTVIAVPSGSYVEAVVTNNPVAYWRLGELSGTTAFDYAGGNHAAYANATLGQPGALGSDSNTCPRFNGSSTYVGAGASLGDNRAAFTMEGWFKLNAAPASMGFWGQNDAIEFGLINATTLQIWTSGGGSLNIPYSWGQGSWHHVVTVGSGSDLRMYVDGVLVGTSSASTANYGSSAYAFNIGGGGIWGPSGNWFNGWIDEVAFYDRALSATEIQRHFLLGLPLPVVTLTAPTNGATFFTATATNIALAASTTANGHALTKVQFFDDTSLLDEDATAPYSGVWNNVGPTNAAVQAVLVYDSGSVTSAVASVTVVTPVPPVIEPGMNVSEGNFNFQFSGVPGRHYRVEWTPKLPAPGPWQVVTDIQSLATSPAAVSVAATNGSAFYRVGLVP